LRELYLELAQFEGDHVSFLIRKRLQERKTAGEEA
jgi:hypothetical protein